MLSEPLTYSFYCITSLLKHIHRKIYLQLYRYSLQDHAAPMHFKDIPIQDGITEKGGASCNSLNRWGNTHAQDSLFGGELDEGLMLKQSAAG